MRATHNFAETVVGIKGQECANNQARDERMVWRTMLSDGLCVEKLQLLKLTSQEKSRIYEYQAYKDTKKKLEDLEASSAGGE